MAIDAFIQQDPSMLDAFLRKATTSDPSTEMFQICVALLSAPLPLSVPLPLSAQEFFMRAFEKAVKSMEEHHVGVVHSLLNGACGDLLGILPDDRIEHIEEKAYGLLKNSGAKPDSDEDRSKLHLLCLGLMGILAPSCEPKAKKIVPRDPMDDHNPLLLPQRSSPIKHLEEIPRMFRGSAARATMHLTVTLATGVLSNNSKSVDGTTVNYLNIASNILTVMPLDVRQDYFDQSVKYMSKFIEKVLKAGSHPGIQLQGLVCIGLLHEGRRLPASVVSAYSKALLSARQIPQEYLAFAEAVRLSLPRFAAQLDEGFIRDVLCSAVKATVQSTSQPSELQWLHLLTQLLGEVAQDTTREWRTRLAKELEVYDKQRVDLIERRMGEVCRDLETRCEQVEEPLQLEHLKVQALQDEIETLRRRNEDLSKQITSLETRDVDREFFMEGLETEKVQAENQLKHADEINKDLSKKVDDLQHRLDEANKAAERTLIQARQEQDRMKSELRALLAKEETRCEEQAATIDDLKTNTAKIEGDLVVVRQSLEQERTTGEELRETLDNAMQHVEEQKTAKLQAQAEVSDLMEKESVLMDQLRQAHANLTEAHTTALESQAEHETAVAALNIELESLRSAAESELQRVEEEASRAHEMVETQLQAAQQEINSVVGDKERLSADMQTRDSQIARLQRKIEKLTDARDSAEAKVEEMEAWRNGILSAMGGPATGMFEKNAVSRRHTGSLAASTIPRQHGRRRTFAESEINSESDSNEDPDLTESERTQSPGEAFGSQRDPSASPTPKRAKVQRQQPFKPPMLKPPSGPSDSRRRSTRLSQSRGASAVIRKPLGDISSEQGNISPVRRSMGAAKMVSFGVPRSSSKSPKHDVALGGSFDVSEFLAGTPLTPSRRHRQEIDAGRSGDTTVDL
ncbi:hypothetical protein SLS57_001410 [Botryosphaeria dothidea]